MSDHDSGMVIECAFDLNNLAAEVVFNKRLVKPITGMDMAYLALNTKDIMVFSFKSLKTNTC